MWKSEVRLIQLLSVKPLTLLELADALGLSYSQVTKLLLRLPVSKKRVGKKLMVSMSPAPEGELLRAVVSFLSERTPFPERVLSKGGKLIVKELIKKKAPVTELMAKTKLSRRTVYRLLSLLKKAKLVEKERKWAKAGDELMAIGPVVGADVKTDLTRYYKGRFPLRIFMVPKALKDYYLKELSKEYRVGLLGVSIGKGGEAIVVPADSLEEAFVELAQTFFAYDFTPLLTRHLDSEKLIWVCKKKKACKPIGVYLEILEKLGVPVKKELIRALYANREKEKIRFLKTEVAKSSELDELEKKWNAIIYFDVESVVI